MEQINNIIEDLNKLIKDGELPIGSEGFVPHDISYNRWVIMPPPIWHGYERRILFSFKNKYPD